MTSLRQLLPLPRWRRPPIAPDAPFTAIGDIHGRDDLLELALPRLDGMVVCVGDYVDRGPDSAGVLRRLMEREDIVCLMGNHEEMMLDFLEDPVRGGARWLNHGGSQTLQSFEVTPPGDVDATTVKSARDALRAAMGEDLVTWLATRSSLWSSGNVAVVHAGADPSIPIPDQDLKALRWGHRDFGHKTRRDGVWVVHGHTIVEQPKVSSGTIAIDTGAWSTSRLTLAHVSKGRIRFEVA